MGATDGVAEEGAATSSRVRSLGRRVTAGLRRVPPRLRLVIGACLALALGVGATILPLLHPGTDVRAEVAGMVPDSATVGQTVQLDLAIDNSGGAVISPICLAIDDHGGQIDVREVRFQGLDVVEFHNGRACGGSLSGQETISIRVLLIPRRAGAVQLSLTGAQGDRAIGPTRSGVMRVTG